MNTKMAMDEILNLINKLLMYNSFMNNSGFDIFPTTFKHDHHDHHCGCVKCYFNKIAVVSKIEFVWIIEYFLFFTILDSYTKNLKPSRLFNLAYPRSPPLYK